MKKLIDKIDWLLFGIFLLAAFTPLVYKFYRMYLTSQIDSDTISFAVNWGYINMIFEAVNIFAIIPAYWFIKRNANDQVTINRNFSISFLFTCIVIVVLVISCVLVGAPIANSSINDWESIHPNIPSPYSFYDIYKYIILYGFTLSLHMFVNLFIVYIVIHNKKLIAFCLTLSTMTIIMSCDTLFLNTNINPNANLMSIPYSLLISTFINVIIAGFFVMNNDYASWKKSFKYLNRSEIFEGFKVYSKNGMFLGLEAVVWNTLNILGVTIWLTNSNIETSFWIMDGIFWSFLLLPATAVSMFTAEGLSNEPNNDGKKDIMKVSFVLVSLALASWIILAPILVLLAVPTVLNNNTELIEMTKKMCWVIILFIAFQVPTRVIYTYFATIGRSQYLLLGTSIGAGIVWGISLTLFLSGVQMNKPEIWIPIIYGVGILVIFIIYFILYLWIKDDVEQTKRLLSRRKEKAFVASKLK